MQPQRLIAGKTTALLGKLRGSTSGTESNLLFTFADLRRSKPALHRPRLGAKVVERGVFA
jgi:hypothetical protein